VVFRTLTGIRRSRGPVLDKGSMFSVPVVKKCNLQPAEVLLLPTPSYLKSDLDPGAFEMDDDLTTELSATYEIEFLPTERDDFRGEGATICLCCG
jgi:hypothetical protein